MSVSISFDKETKGLSIRAMHDISGQKFRWVLEMDQNEFSRHASGLSLFSLHLLAECQKSPSIADALLALEAIVREIERENGVEQP